MATSEAIEDQTAWQPKVITWRGERESYRIEQHVAPATGHPFVTMEINNNGQMRQALTPELAVRLANDLLKAVDGLAARN